MKRLNEFESPMQDREILSDREKREERLMLQIRLREGIDLATFTESQREKLNNFKEELEFTGDSVVLTRKGRLVADRIVRELVI